MIAVSSVAFFVSRLTFVLLFSFLFFFFSSRRRHTRFDCDWSSDVCSSDLSATARRKLPLAAPSAWCATATASASTFPTAASTCWSPTRSWPAAVPSRMPRAGSPPSRSEEHTSELQSQSNLVCRLLLEKKKQYKRH